MKIISKGSVLHSQNFYEKKRKRMRVWLWFWFISLLILIAFLIYLSRQERFLISEVAVTGENVVERAEIKQTVEDLLRGHYLWIIPRSNALLYPKHTIEKSLAIKFPRHKSIDLNIDKLRTLSVSIEEYAPFALYCPSTTCYFLDETGYIFALAPSFSVPVYFIYTTLELLENPIGQRLMPAEEFKNLPEFIKSLGILNINPVSLSVADEEYILYLSNGGEIVWKRKSDQAIIRANLEAFLSDEAIKSQANFLDRVTYLDLRTDNKVFYKLK